MARGAVLTGEAGTFLVEHRFFLVAPNNRTTTQSGGVGGRGKYVRKAKVVTIVRNPRAESFASFVCFFGKEGEIKDVKME